MSTDNVTPIRDWHREASDRIESLGDAIMLLPADDLAPGYRLPLQTVIDLRRICGLFDEAQQLLDNAVEREDEPYNDYCEQLEAQGIIL